MTQAADPIQRALEYMRHQGAKSLDDLIALMDRTSAEWSRPLEGMTEAQAAFQPEGEWCAKQVLGHLIDANRGINQQIAEMVGVESPRQSPRVRAMGETSADLEELSVDALRGVIREVFDETKALIGSAAGSDKLDQKFPHPLFGPLNLKEWFAFHRVHAMDHVQQIDKLIACPGYLSA